MTTSTISHALTCMFKDDDWFWKVSLGSLALLLIGLGIGYVLVIGYYVETVRRCRTNDTVLPEWTGLGLLFRSGLVVGGAMLSYSVLMVLVLAAFHRAGIVGILAGVVVVHAFVQPFVTVTYLETGTLRSCYDLRGIASLIRRNGLRSVEVTAAGFGIFVTVLCFGWMALIVGWPFFIFWGMLAAAAFTASLAPTTPQREAAAQ